MLLVVGGEKGGSGKSTISQNLAVFLARAGYDVLLLDADPQGTTRDWAAERQMNEGLAGLTFEHATGDLRKILADRVKRYQMVVVDAGGADSLALRSAMAVATHVLLPLRPKRRDLKTLPNLDLMIAQAKTVNPDLVVRAVITQCPTLPSQVKRILDAKEACRSFEIEPLDAITMQRNAYDDADEGGESVFEIAASDTKAIEEVEAIAKELWS
ncbi:AAA family ATPase [Stutzerimonas zhaodongensis]|uniref:AAA family ATPase n=1 Tax=Stutzerimonas zhaodongensis TaxID=1176257 RepID=UPI0021043B9F|nr:AAA family ATPase [Stutzerimonas zhaodongensis]MCQ2032244.1 AAA family ATPase [Stutzerimonas zhaodongensis]